jgi:hypothetical protein
MSASARATVPSRLRWAGALASAAALGALIAIGPPGAARAAGGPGYDQITGAGVTDSAITVPWTHGLLDANNQPIASANADRGSASPTSPYSFMYSDFKNLSVTVSQTKDITQQGITVSWKGGAPTFVNGAVAANFLQLMECYGDSSSGPDPNACEYGTSAVESANTGLNNPHIGSRGSARCAAGAVPSVTNPPRSWDDSNPLQGCDPQEPVAGANPPDMAPCPGSSCDPAQFSIPFVPVSDPGHPVYQSDLSQWFDQSNTNEVQAAITSSDGTGQLQFETLTSTQSPGLGCGERESSGQPRGCWLVIVPRGQYEPNGFKLNFANSSQGGPEYIQSSPLGASNWAMRIQVHLGYAPVPPHCPIGTQERETVGTQVVSRAVRSWQLALNRAANCSRIFGYTAVPEATSTQQLSTPGSGTGLAFTTIPIGSEAARGGGHGSTAHLPPIVYAPVAVSAVGFGFNISNVTGQVITPVKLSPELLAKGLTQVYLHDLPDWYPYNPVSEGLPPSGTHPGPTWSQSNPGDISNDPQFMMLNPEIPPYRFSTGSLAPLLTEDHSAINQQIWQWIQADSATGAWLDSGTKDAANSVTADPDYEKLMLGKPPAIDSFPRAYAACLDLGIFKDPPQAPKDVKRCSLDLLPYTDNYDSAGASVLLASNTTRGSFCTCERAPDGTDGYFQKNGIQPVGQIFIWGISDTPDLAAYGLIDAKLCNDAGTACVAPSTASVTTALNSATKDSAGLLQVNPARPGNGGYPLVQVTYAAVPTNQSAAALNDYADLIAYAAGQGQTPGVEAGDLPPGYLPLPASLKTQAQAVVARLRAIANPTPTRSHSPPPTSGSPPASPGPGTPSSTTPQPSSSPPGASPSQPNPTPGATASTPGLAISPPSAQLTGTTTPRQGVGGIRWVLLAVVLAGAVSAALGAVLRYARVPRWLHRMRP